MKLCQKCGNPYEDSVRNCPCCGTASDSTDLPGISNDDPPLPIWITRSTDDPLDDLSEDSLNDNSFGNSTEPQQHTFENMKHNDSYDSSQGDFFDEIADTASTLFSNMSPKMKRFLLWTLIGTLLSIIPFFYFACAHHKDTAGDSGASASYAALPLDHLIP